MNKETAAGSVLNVQIDRLVIDGIELSHDQQRQLKAAMLSSLRHLFTEHGIPEGMSSLPSASGIRADDIRSTGAAVQPSQLGEQIAGSIYHRLSKQS